MSLGNIGNTRSDAQRENLLKTVGAGRCTFCDGEGFDPTVNLVIWRGKFWRCWSNPFPYHHHQAHFILASISHYTAIGDIPPGAWIEWGQINQRLIERYNLQGGALVMRFGDNAYNGGTLSHVHSHIQVPDLTGPAFATFFKNDHFRTFISEVSLRAKLGPVPSVSGD